MPLARATQSLQSRALLWTPLLQRLAPTCTANFLSAGLHSSSAASSSAAGSDSGGGSSSSNPDVFTASLAAKTEEELRQMVLNQGKSTAAAGAQAEEQASAAGVAEDEAAVKEGQVSKCSLESTWRKHIAAVLPRHLHSLEEHILRCAS